MHEQLNGPVNFDPDRLSNLTGSIRYYLRRIKTSVFVKILIQIPISSRNWADCEYYIEDN